MDYIQFNLLEGLFWIALGIISFVLIKILPKHFKQLTVFSAYVLILFGISDFAEIEFGSFFEPGMIWLFMWKILCVAGLIIAIIWYLWLRIFHNQFKK